MSKTTEQDKKLAFDTGVAAFVNQMFDANCKETYKRMMGY